MDDDSAHVPVTFEHYGHVEGPFYHGTRASVGPGDQLVPGYSSNFKDGRISNSIYFTATLDAAIWGAELAKGEGTRRIYIVEPTGPSPTPLRHSDVNDASPGSDLFGFDRNGVRLALEQVCDFGGICICQLYTARATGAAPKSARMAVPAAAFSVRNIVVNTVLAISRFRHRNASR